MHCWSYTAGAKGHTVTVYERVSGGPLQARCFDPSLREGKGGYRRVALGHRDREKGKTYAHAGLGDGAKAPSATGRGPGRRMGEH